MTAGRAHSDIPRVGPPIEARRITDATNAAIEAGSCRLLAAILRYGIRHDRDFGMGAEAFWARCEQAGVDRPGATRKATAR